MLYLPSPGSGGGLDMPFREWYWHWWRMSHRDPRELSPAQASEAFWFVFLHFQAILFAAMAVVVAAGIVRSWLNCGV